MPPQDYEWVLDGRPSSLDDEGLPMGERRANPFYWDSDTRHKWAQFVKGSRATAVRDWWDMDNVEEAPAQLDNIDWNS